MIGNILGIIPARYGSSRLEGKPLVDIMGKPMIQHVYERACEAIEVVYVATDDERIYNTVKEFGGRVVMTSANHTTGTNRCLEASMIIGEEYAHQIVVNIQGDEPLISPGNLETLCGMFDEDGVEFATLIKRIRQPQDIRHGYGVYVVRNLNYEALYFSRSAIPFIREEDIEAWGHKHQFYHHVGVYAYTTDALMKFAGLPKSSLESAENLEQNRWIENGGVIKVAEVEEDGIGVDTPEDLARIRKIMEG